MTSDQKSQIMELRKQGSSLADVADRLSLPIGTVKSFWRRHSAFLKVEEDPKPEESQHQEEFVEIAQPEENRCKRCGASIISLRHHRPKLFCSDKCRLSWWHENRHLARGTELKTCPTCGTSFTADGRRKYCSHNCYIKSRYATTKQSVGGAETL